MKVREIARAHGIAESSIRRRAKLDGWSRIAADFAQADAEKSAFGKVEEFNLSDIRILANTYSIPAVVEDQFDLSKAARSLAYLALVSLAHLTATAKSEAVRRQAAHELLSWGFGKPLGIADGDGAPRTSRQQKAKSLGKKEALVEAANNPDTATAMGKMMAQRAAAVRRSH